MKLFIDVLANALLMGAGLAFCYIFLSIHFTGGYMAVEPNHAILVGEIILGLIMFTLGIIQLAGRYRNRR